MKIYFHKIHGNCQKSEKCLYDENNGEIIADYVTVTQDVFSP